MKYERVGEEEAAAEQDLALFVLLQDLRTEGNNVGDQSIIVLFR
jgi:hypothetical protein